MKTDDLNISLVNLYEEMKLYISNFIKSFNEKNVNEMVNNLELILRFQCKYSSDIIELFIKSCVLFYFVKIIQERSLFPNPHIIDLVVSVLLLLANNSSMISKCLYDNNTIDILICDFSNNNNEMQKQIVLLLFYIIYDLKPNELLPLLNRILIFVLKNFNLEPIIFSRIVLLFIQNSIILPDDFVKKLINYLFMHLNNQMNPFFLLLFYELIRRYEFIVPYVVNGKFINWIKNQFSYNDEKTRYLSLSIFQILAYMIPTNGLNFLIPFSIFTLIFKERNEFKIHNAILVFILNIIKNKYDSIEIFYNSGVLSTITKNWEKISCSNQIILAEILFLLIKSDHTYPDLLLDSISIFLHIIDINESTIIKEIINSFIIIFKKMELKGMLNNAKAVFMENDGVNILNECSDFKDGVDILFNNYLT